MSKLKDRTMFVIRRRGQNLFLDETSGDRSYSGFGESTTLIPDEVDALTKLESLPDFMNLELVPVQIRFSKPLAWRAVHRAVTSANRPPSTGSRRPIELAA